jgi:hypothetical protein
MLAYGNIVLCRLAAVSFSLPIHLALLRLALPIPAAAG